MNDQQEYEGSWWSSINVQEMICFSGVSIKMSVHSREIGNYKSYFT